MPNNYALKSILYAGAAFVAFPATAQAQVTSPSAEAEEGLVVIGQRQQYRGDVPIEEIPQSIQILDSELLTDLNVTRLDSALDLASGISRQNNFGGLWDSFAVRGFAGDENYPSGFLVNGFNGGRGFGGVRDASNIERIEILKGPNGAVFGRGEPGGTVNIITKKAKTEESFGSFTASAGSFDTYRIEGDYNLPISDTLAIRLNGASEQAGSFRDTQESQKYVASPSVLFAPTSGTVLTYEMEFVDQKVPFDRGVVAVNDVLGLIPRSRFLGEPGNGPIRVKVLGHQVQFQQDLGSNDWVFIAGFGYRDTSFYGFASDAELAGSRQIIDDDGMNLARQRRFRDYNTENMVMRGEVSGRLYTGSITHHVLIGADWDRFEIDLYQTRYRPPSYTPGSPITPANNAINIFNPVYGQLPVPNSVITDSLEVQKSYGIYFQDQIDITDRFKVRIGGRYDHFRQSINNRAAATVLPVTVEKRFSPTAGVLYEVTDSISVYGSFGKGFRPNSGLDAFSNPFAPETSESYEGGLRFVSHDKAITATLAAYWMKKTNILTSDPINAGFSIAGGEARSRGIEADINGKLPGDILVYATYSYTDAQWTSASLDPNFAALITPGDPLINIPKHQANLVVTKGFDVGTVGKITVGAGVNYVGKRLGETASSFYLPSYTLVRLLASVEPAENIRIGVDVTNLFNKEYYPSSYHRYWVTPGAPRAFTVRGTFSF